MGKLEASLPQCVAVKNQNNLFIHEMITLPPPAAYAAHFNLCVITSDVAAISPKNEKIKKVSIYKSSAVTANEKHVSFSTEVFIKHINCLPPM